MTVSSVITAMISGERLKSYKRGHWPRVTKPIRVARPNSLSRRDGPSSTAEHRTPTSSSRTRQLRISLSSFRRPRSKFGMKTPDRKGGHAPGLFSNHVRRATRVPKHLALRYRTSTRPETNRNITMCSFYFAHQRYCAFKKASD